MNTEDYIKKIWDMLDNPQAYSEEEILALLHDNEEAREAYRQIVEVKRSYRQVHAADKSIDVDKAWERFAAEHPVEVKRHRSLVCRHWRRSADDERLVLRGHCSDTDKE